METNLGRLEDRLKVRFDQVDARFNQVEGKLGRLENRVEARSNQVDVKMDALRNLIFILFGVAAGLVTVFGFIR